jgi:hypothetical protein
MTDAAESLKRGFAFFETARRDFSDVFVIVLWTTERSITAV